MSNFLEQKPIKFEEEDRFHLLAQKGLGDALEEGLIIAERYAQAFVSMEEGSKLGLAEFLHGINLRWDEFDSDGETFWEWSDRVINKDKETIKRRICTWEWLSGGYIPSPYRDGIESFSIGMLEMAYSVSVKCKRNKYTGQYDFEPAEFEIEPHQWRNMAEAADKSMLLEVIDDIKDREPNSNRTAFKIDSRGQVWYYKGKQGGVVVAEFLVNSADGRVREGAELLIESAGIKDKNE